MGIEFISLKKEEIMEESNKPARKLSLSSTKKELFDAYMLALKQLEERRKAELQPQKIVEEKKKAEVLSRVEGLTLDGVANAISSVRSETSRILGELSDRLEAEVEKYRSIQEAIAIKNQELKEIYEIESSALTLATLIEAHKQKRKDLEEQIAREKEELLAEIAETRKKWEEEKKQYELEKKEREEAEKKARQREKEDYLYSFAREQKIESDKFADLKAKLEKELALKKEDAEKELAEREKRVAEREEELAELNEKVAKFPKELEAAVARAVKETSEALKAQFKNREEFLLKEFEGERNVLNTRIAILEKQTAEQNEKIRELSEKLERAYEKVQEVAVRAIEGASQSKSFTDLQKILSEKVAKFSPEREKA